MKHAFLAAVMVLAGALPALAQDLPEVPIEVVILPGDTSVGSTIVVEVRIKSPMEIIGMSIGLEYDPLVVEAPAYSPWEMGESWEPNNDHFQAINEAEGNGAGWNPAAPARIQYDGIDMNMSDDISLRPAGVVLRARFTVIATGAFTFKMRYDYTTDPANPDERYMVLIDPANNAILGMPEINPSFDNTLPVTLTLDVGTFALIGTSLPVTAEVNNPNGNTLLAQVVELHVGSTLLGSVVVDLPPGTTSIPLPAWSTGGWPAGTYSVSATVVGTSLADDVDVTLANPTVSTPPSSGGGGGGGCASGSNAGSMAPMVIVLALLIGIRLTR